MKENNGMAYMSQTEQQLKLHEFFDNLKERAFKHIADGGELMESSSSPGADVLSLTFLKKPSPKYYNFNEAYAMMKTGKWMRRVGMSTAICKCCGYWSIRCDGAVKAASGAGYNFSTGDIESLWEEVQP